MNIFRWIYCVDNTKQFVSVASGLLTEKEIFLFHLRQWQTGKTVHSQRSMRLSLLLCSAAVVAVVVVVVVIIVSSGIRATSTTARTHTHTTSTTTHSHTADSIVQIKSIVVEHERWWSYLWILCSHRIDRPKPHEHTSGRRRCKHVIVQSCRGTYEMVLFFTYKFD